MAIYGACMVTIAAAAKGMSSGPGSFLAAAAGVPVGIIIVLIQWSGGRAVSVPTLWSVVFFALAGICSTYLGRWLVFKSIEQLGPSGSAGLQSVSPLITAALGWIFLGEVIGTIGVVGIALGIAGLLAMSIGIDRSQRNTARPALSIREGSRPSFMSATLLIGIGSAAAYSFSHVFRASGVRQWNEALLGALIGALAGLLVLALANRERMPEYVRQARSNPKAARIFLGVGCLQFLAQALVIASMKYIPASMTALITMCTPLVVLPVSYFALGNHERLSWVTVLGIMITLTGITLVVLYGAPAP
jgi:drug/metabolite transporter (DMT)-like permease